MTKNDTTKKYVRFKNVGNHLDSLYKRMWAHFVETESESYYLLEGKKVSPTEMDALYPIVDLQKNSISKGDLLDGRIII